MANDNHDSHDVLTGLPAGWMWTTLGEVAKINSRDPALRALPDNLSVTFVPMAAVDAISGTIATPTERPLSAVRKGFTPFSNGDVLFAKITPCMENGKAAIARDLKNGRGFGSTEFHIFSPRSDVKPEWIFYFVRQESFRRDAKAQFAGTAGQLRVPGSFLETCPIPFAPLPEQHRIVAKIEEQFTRLDAGIAALKRAQANLKRYKAAVLKAAREGKLVAQDPSDEPASELLKRILAERRAKWEADLHARGKSPKKAKYEEPQAPDIDELPELPSGWCWANLAQLSWDAGYGTSQKCDYEASGPPVLRIPNIVNGGFNLNDLKFATKPDELNDAGALALNDMLIIRTNGSKDLIGRCGLVRQPFERQNFFASYMITQGSAIFIAGSHNFSPTSQVRLGALMTDSPTLMLFVMWIIYCGARTQIRHVNLCSSGACLKPILKTPFKMTEP